VSILGPKVAKNGGVLPLKFVRGHMNTPVGDKLFQDIPRCVAKFRENHGCRKIGGRKKLKKLKIIK